METAYVLVQCKIAHEMEVLKALLEIDLVKEAKGTFGYYDIFTKIQGESSSEIEDIITRIFFIESFLLKIIKIYEFNFFNCSAIFSSSIFSNKRFPLLIR